MLQEDKESQQPLQYENIENSRELVESNEIKLEVEPQPEMCMFCKLIKTLQAILVMLWDEEHFSHASTHKFQESDFKARL